MCTVSWRFDAKGYDLFFNRDELNTRAQERTPSIAERAGVNFLAPQDGDSGGTWLLANEFGITVCLLNDYANPWRPPSERVAFSRGQVVSSCAAVANHDDVWATVEQCPLAQTRPFHLAVFSCEEGPLVLHWNGSHLRQLAGSEVTPPFSSSSFATSEVIAARVSRFRSMVQAGEFPVVAEMAAYHRQHESGRGAHSVLMRRPDACTRSIIHVRVDPTEVQLTYSPVEWTLADEPRLISSRHVLARRVSVVRIAREVATVSCAS